MSAFVKVQLVVIYFLIRSHIYSTFIFVLVLHFKFKILFLCPGRLLPEPCG